MYIPQFVVYTYHIIIYIPQTLFWGSTSSVARHLGYFHLLTFVSSAAKNVCTRTCLSTYFQFFWIYTWSRIAGSYGNSMFKFLRNCQIFSIVAEPLYTPTKNIQGSSFSSFSPFVFCLFVFLSS